MKFGIEAIKEQKTIAEIAAEYKYYCPFKKKQCFCTAKEGIRLAVEKFGAERITIEAQVYARGLYEKVGFVQISDEFLEDGIHVYTCS